MTDRGVGMMLSVGDSAARLPVLEGSWKGSDL
jgi:hypothetical protein